jgi:hypothetical protein
MTNNSEINKVIIETVENSCDDQEVQELIKDVLKYELDIWNRHVLPSTIQDEYERIVDQVLKRSKQ